jgi:hypothetical protein
MANHEARPQIESVDLLLAFSRTKDGVKNRKCIRTIIRDYDLDLAVLEAKLKLMGGTWRIHKTVNSRDTEKARKWIIHKLIDNPEFAGCVDSLWRTALLQPEHVYGEKKFMFDIDTKDEEILGMIINKIKEKGTIKEIIETPAGVHIITNKFNTQDVCQIPVVSLIRDGYVFIKKIEYKGDK